LPEPKRSASSCGRIGTLPVGWSVVRPGHCTELDGEYLALSVLKLFDLVLDVFGNDLFGSGVLVVPVLRSLVPHIFGGFWCL
jgi:hypothetical protein